MSLISQFITVLNKAEIHPSSEELADVFWLALQIDVPIIKNKPELNNDDSISNQEDDNKQPPENKALPEKPPETPPVKLPATEKQQQKSQLFPHQQNGSGINTGIKGQAFRTPALSLLHNALAFNRAFRPLRKTVASRFYTELAIEETVQYIAETHIFSPILKGKPERWLELVIIIDDAISMKIWQPLLKEFRRLLELQGTFTKINFYQLNTENDEAQVLKNNRVIRNFEIINTHQPRLIMVLSDCVAKAWHSNNGVFNLLQQWSQKHPVSILQMLPYRLWKGTALGYAEEARFTAPLPLALNKNLNIDAQDFWFIDDISELQKGFKIPVLTLEPEIVKTWAKLVLGKKDNWLKGVVFENKTILIPPLEQEPEKTVNEITAEQRIKQFRSFASPMAQQLAAYLATVPLDLSVMNVVQKLMLPQSQQLHLAEVFLGGLLKRVPNHQWLEYDFHAGVRELLLDTVIVADAVFVLTRVSDFVEQRFGQSLDFLALLKNPNLIDGIELNEQTRPFAEVGAKILRRLGGEYEALSERMMSYQTSDNFSANSVIDQVMGKQQADESSLISIRVMRHLNPNPYMSVGGSLDYEPDFNFDAINCEFYVNGFGSGNWSHNGPSTGWIEAYLSVSEQDGTLLNVGMWIRYQQSNGKESECFSLGCEFEPNYWFTSFTFYKGGNDPKYNPNFSYIICSFSFFIDVQKKTGEIVRYWQSHNGANYTIDEVFAVQGYEKSLGSGSIKYANESSVIFDMKRVCQNYVHKQIDSLASQELSYQVESIDVQSSPTFTLIKAELTPSESVRGWYGAAFEVETKYLGETEQVMLTFISSTYDEVITGVTQTIRNEKKLSADDLQIISPTKKRWFFSLDNIENGLSSFLILIFSEIDSNIIIKDSKEYNFVTPTYKYKNVYRRLYDCHNPVKYWKSRSKEFLDWKLSQKVRLVWAELEPGFSFGWYSGAKFYIEIENISYEKRVILDFGYNNQRDASYFCSVSNNKEIWFWETPYDEQPGKTANLKFTIQYLVGGNQYWDDNQEWQYTMNYKYPYAPIDWSGVD